MKNACLAPSDVAPPAADSDVHMLHPFAGRHLVAQYLNCDNARLTDHAALIQAMRDAVAASGATLLSMTDHAFEGGGLTAVMLLSESHASIHTYPEYDACFVDLFTCGYACRAEEFDAVLRTYLSPETTDCKILVRARPVGHEEP